MRRRYRSRSIGGSCWRQASLAQMVSIPRQDRPGAAHAAAIEDMGEGALDQLAAPAHRLAPDIRSQPHPIGVDHFARRLVAMPTQVALGRLGFGDARLPHAILERLQLFARVIPLVGDHDAGRILARRQPSQRRRDSDEREGFDGTSFRKMDGRPAGRC